MPLFRTCRTLVYIAAITIVLEGGFEEKGEERERWQIFGKDVRRYQLFQSVWQNPETIGE